MITRRKASTAKGPRGLTPLVGAAMASVAAGSLIMFSLLAEKVVEPRGHGVAVTPRVPREVDAERSLTVPPPPPEHVGGTPPSATETVLPPAPVPDEPISPSVAEGDRRLPKMAFVSYSGPALDVPRHGRVGYRGPQNRVTLDPPEPRECPGRPDKAREPGTHPHGGPPACGNPHGEPPGHGDERGNPHGGPPGRSNERGNPHGGKAGKHGEQKSQRPAPASHTEHDGPPDHSAAGGNPPSSDGGNGPSGPPAGHPHGGPPGHAGDHGNPHGKPPGQAKKGN